ncbi:hypothetical protein DLE01_16375 [Streptomyces sp. FT05W]|uniref:Secreted protein n=1 Tax=[Kitasatospora] papulosa TaxID=1464011 RepID=A0ABZ1KAE6_9ACTN|nr:MULTISPECIES: hypothetical protein [unclassified Streptomyces]MBD2833614.1 hypothetical protein [Streptomyces pratensis]MDX3181815.1 hypothetical protein [Streptomyces sp. ME02-7008A-1]MDX3302541.1 hypothetical protein [Streptomyces sp. ME02-7008A]PWS50767.1 hypothetical protein DLE01_16375 [Streptomyces sp. FT05W]
MRAAMTRIRFKGAAVAAASVAMAVMLTACGGDGGSGTEQKQPKASASEKQQTPDAVESSDSSEVLASVKGPGDIELVVNSAQRNAGGFITVKGSVTNGSKQQFGAQGWQGDEQEMVGNGASVAGASLVDQAGKKRYLTLRDTDGRCLCTKFTTGIAPGATSPFFVQFPAPPADTTEVDFQIPTMPTATIKISG